MADTGRHVTTQLADLAAVIERAAADLALAEEPSDFAVALEQAAGDPGDADD